MTLPDHLLSGYSRFRSGRYAQDEERYRTLGAGVQQPKMMIIACCDSRAAPETIFDAGPGEIFVMRNVANLVPPYAPDGGHHSTSAAIEFAVLSLGVKDIVVMGHGRCGGIRAVVEGGNPLSAGDFIGKWMSDVRDVADAVRQEHDHGNDFQMQWNTLRWNIHWRIYGRFRGCECARIRATWGYTVLGLISRSVSCIAMTGQRNVGA